jgi:hypothetical protein
MAEVMNSPDGQSMLSAMVEVFTGFWARDRRLLKRIHGIAAIDPEFGQAVEARNRRRWGIATRVVERLFARADIGGEEKSRKVACLVALTSFEFFDVLAESCGTEEMAAKWVYSLATKALATRT